MNNLIQAIFSIDSPEKFNNVCLSIFKFQYSENKVYRQYVEELGVKVPQITNFLQIPFLPIEFFKTHQIISGNKTPETLFKSSGTTGVIQSTHFVCDVSIYEKSFHQSFKEIYGDPENYTFLALLPSYSDRKESSLVYMVRNLMQKSKKAGNGFYLYNFPELYQKIVELEKNKEETILFGVSFALIDFFEIFKPKLASTTVIETGGMKGKRKEMTRQELHDFIKSSTNLENIHSEYGMTELLSQAYSKGESKFKTPAWMKVLIRDVNDPFTILTEGLTGGINVIDLANLYSCSFIETKDLGKSYADGTFEVSGRFDNSDVRGCNLMAL